MKPTDPPIAIPHIRGDDLFCLKSLYQTIGEALGLKRTTLRRELRLRRLRHTVISGRVVIRGCWVHQWIEGREVRPPAGEIKPGRSTERNGRAGSH
jgi:hypothetical protein